MAGIPMGHGLYGGRGTHTGGKGVFTRQAHCEFIVSSETVHPPITHQAHAVRVVRPAYYSELQRISRRGCGGNLSIKGGTKILKKVNKSGCVATVALIS